MRVLQISNYLYPHIGGIEQTARDFAEVIKGENIEQKIICFNENASDSGYVTYRNEDCIDEVDGVQVIRCACVAKVASQSISLSYPWKLKETLDTFDPDVVILHYPNPYVSSFLLKMLKKHVRFVLYWHLDITKQKILGKLFHFQTIKLLKRADVIIATSPNYVSGSPYLKRFESKCTVIPSCIDIDRLQLSDEIITHAKHIRECYQDKFICLAVGRHVEYKGLEYLVRAAKYLDDRFVVLIGGDGPLTQSLIELAKDTPKVNFLGRIADMDLVAYYYACNVFCFPSITKNEAFGLALAEGMYFGKPAVTFTIPGSGVNFVNLNGVTGIECPNCDSKVYAEALMRLAADDELCKKYGEAGRQRVQELFLKNTFHEKIKKLICE